MTRSSSDKVRVTIQIPRAMAEKIDAMRKSMGNPPPGRSFAIRHCIENGINTSKTRKV